MQIVAGLRTLRAQAHTILRDAIVEGRFVPGERLNEVQLAEEIGVSRGTLREAMRNLEQEGLLVSNPHRGTFVRQFTAQEADELQEVRLGLEITAACRIGEKLGPAAERLLEERLTQLETAYTAPLPFPERLKADLGFHEAICEAAGNSTLTNVWRSLVGNITVMVLSVGPERMTPLQNPGAHRDLIGVIKTGDPNRIREAFTEHFTVGQRVIAAAFAGRDAPARLRDGAG